MALDLGTARLEDRFDATQPLRSGRFVIRDDHPRDRWLSVPEIFIYSSNIGAARMAMEVGTDRQREFLGRMGLLDRLDVRLPEVGAPLVPNPWRDINTITVSYGHGLAVSPLQFAAAVATTINGGWAVSPTLVKSTAPPPRTRVLAEATSLAMRRLMRLNVEQGTGGLAAAPGFLVGGKTGTAEKQIGGRYAAKSLISSFVGVFPMNRPRYVVLAILDEPKGNAESLGYATGGWTAAPAVGRIIAQMAPLLGIAPIDEDAAAVRRAMAISINSLDPKVAAF
jgi:cell division protein FtsI (penicillin-binding protein 3)